jgi:outer membrane lipoprotein-sorting protein
MRRADNTEQIIKENLSFTASAAMHNRILNDVLAAQEQAKKTKSGLAQANLWRTVMKSPLTKLATAAIVAIACLIGLSLWRGTESGIALADVLARVEQVKAVRYKWTYTIDHHIDPNKPYHVEWRKTYLNSQEYGTKGNWELLDPNGGESTFSEIYILPQKKTTIIIEPKQKRYTRTEHDDVTSEQMQDDPRALLKGILKYKYESLGRSTIDGIEVAGFRTTDPNHWGGKNPQVDIKLWVDVKTLLPVRYDNLVSEKVNKRGDKMSTHIVEYDFQWDVPVDAADFEPVIPDDYTRTVIKYPAHITEETAIQGLKVLVELLGKYPENQFYFNAPVFLRLAEKSETPAAMRLKEEIKGLTEDEIDNKLVDFLMPIRGINRFYSTLRQGNKDPAYYGKIVTPTDADKVLMRWKVSDSEYRVIYGDLHAETVTPEKLAELEAALPK